MLDEESFEEFSDPSSSVSPRWINGTGGKLDEKVMIRFVKESFDKHGKIYVGTDSHRSGKNYIFATVVCLHGAENQQGGNYFFFRQKKRKANFNSLHQRLLFETESSLNAANMLRDYGISDIEVHIDCSPKTATHKSGKSADVLFGYVIASGFLCEIKPNSWAAHSIADRHAR